MEGMGDEPTGTAEGAHLKRKDCDPSTNPDCFKLIESQPMVLPMSRWPDTSLVGSEIPFTRPFSTNDANVMVEELMLKTGKNSNLATKVDNSNRMERPPIRAGRWQHLYQLSGESVNGSSLGDSISKDKEPIASYGVEHKSNIFLPEFRVENPLPVPGKQSSQDHVGISEHSIKSDMNMMLSSRRTPANIPSKSGFSQFFGKNKLKERRFEQRHPKTNDGLGAASMGQVHETRGAFNVSPNSSAKPVDQSLLSVAGTGPVLFHDGISLREWLKPGCRKVNKAESLYIFRQIVELVDLAHSRRVALQDMMPSCFKLFPSNRIRYIGSFVQKELLGNVVDQIPPSEHHLSRKMYLEQSACAYGSLCPKRQKLSDDMIFVQRNPGFSANSGFKCESVNEVDSHSIGTQDSGYDTSEKHDVTPRHGIRNRSGRPSVSNMARQQFLSVDPQLEKKWYTSPEEFNEWGFTFSSNIYSLGILLFELFSHFESWEVHAAAMSGLHHRILSPKFLSENPKEAGFCLWLLHPEPSSRPTTREILQSDLVCKSQELSSMDQLSLSVDEDDEAESELLLHFLISLKEQKQKRASKLMEEIEWLKADVEEVEKRHLVKAGVILPSTHGDSNAKELGYVYNDPLSSEALLSNMNGARLTKNINQLENAYFSMRSEIQFPETNSAGHVNRDLLNNRERWSLLQNEDEELVLNHKPIDRLGAFFDGLCKYARYSKFEVRSTVRTGDLINSANVICSLSFDRDEDYFAAAGVAKKIKIFEFHALLDGSVDIHYPVIEMSSNSKFSCVCWNNYIKNYLASTDYDGLVQLWDASTGQVFSQYVEHEKRAWSIDFSQLDPTKFASGSDDCSVKLWSINEKKCISTIRSIANVCCVQFSRSSHLMAFGSADYKTYCYDLRYTRNPWCTLAGHGKAVSYLKFLDSETLVSASTDNTLKLWDLNKTSSSGLSNGACSLTFSGHTNEKNFVGLSVSDGYIACGSETNEVYAYYRSLPMPITSHKFGSIDPISGIETENDNGLFVSSVCWREKSNMVVAANSSGSIKLLQME